MIRLVIINITPSRLYFLLLTKILPGGRIKIEEGLATPWAA